VIACCDLNSPATFSPAFSPVGAKCCRQGREPLVNVPFRTRSPGGATQIAATERTFNEPCRPSGAPIANTHQFQGLTPLARTSRSYGAMRAAIQHSTCRSVDRFFTRCALRIVLLLVASALLVTPLTRAAEPLDVNRIHAATNRGLDWLVAQRHPDGAWRSAHYTQLNAGPGATALAAATLAELRPLEKEAPAPAPSQHAALQSSLAYLLKDPAPAGHVREASLANEYPTYATALTLIALNELPAAERELHADAIRKMQAYLVAAQVTRPLPNKLATADDVGGWGLVGGDPTDPSSFRTSNVSTTRFALEALQPVAAEHPETFARARADGLLALRACGLADDDPHIAAAIAWLDAHPQVDAVPGFAADAVSIAMADGLYYYYAASLAHAIAAYPEADFARQAPTLTKELLYRQRDDGSWANLVPTMREDDPLVATTLALNALATLQTNHSDAKTKPENHANPRE
jgi:hypothetical protein